MSCLFRLLFLLLSFQSLLADPVINQQWLALLHMTNDGKSFADDDHFFLSIEKTAESELRELINRQNDREIRCKFPARYLWLAKQQGKNFDPLENCQDLKDWYQGINPNSVSLVFPSVFMNNPASAFGHTLIKIDRLDQPGLLAYAANYSAHTANEGGLLYAFKGIFGLYPGYFSVLPYYEMIRKYNDLESRDIWEYPLNFNKSETDFLVFHLWELRNIAFDYYYFDENCSYHLLFLFEVVRPELELTKKFPSWVLPIDTLREIINTNLIDPKTRVYRPSVIKNFKNMIKQASSSEITNAKKLIINPKIKADSRSFDLAQEYLNFKALKGYVSETESRSLGFELLQERSALIDQNLFKELPPPAAPETGHKTSRVSFGVGQENNSAYYQLRWRPAYHSLEDPSTGFLPGAQLEFMDFALQQNHDQKLKLDQLKILDIKSYSEVDSFITPISWELSLGSERKRIYQDFDYVNNLAFGVGLSKQFNNVLYYSLITPKLEYSETYQENYLMANQYKLGSIIDFDTTKTNLNFIYSQAYWGEDYTEKSFNISQQLKLTSDQQLRFEIERRNFVDNYSTELSFYFDLFY